MNRQPPFTPPAGFAMVETLVALALLAMVMLGAGAALIESLAGQRAAVMLTIATDIAGNFAESLRASPDEARTQFELQHWQRAAQTLLPEGSLTLLPPSGAATSNPESPLPAPFDIAISWRDSPAESHTLRLPVNPQPAVGGAP